MTLVYLLVISKAGYWHNTGKGEDGVFIKPAVMLFSDNDNAEMMPYRNYLYLH